MTVQPFRPRVRAVVFDVGGTIVDESRQWAGWARWLRVPEPVFFAALGAVIERDVPLREVFSFFCAGDIDPPAVRAQRMSAGEPDEFADSDLYPDARPTLQRLSDAGLIVGIVGNQPRRRQRALEGMGLAADFVATSEEWGVEKPDSRFFARVIELCGVPAEEIAYVGDRVDNDALPASTAGMVGVFLRRGPWGYIQARRPEAALVDLRVDDLSELVRRLVS